MKEVKELKLDTLSEEESNKAYTFQQLSDYYQQQFTISKKGIYYPYNYITRDVGMGCAWRAIQTLLSTHDINESFMSLYGKYSQKKDILKILEDKNAYKAQILKILAKEVWTPAEIELHWAQPFIASIACKANNLPHRFFVINGPAFSYAPSAIFQQTLTFQQFYSLARSVINQSSIMIDDGKFALSIIGINLNHDDQVEFLFGDPHVNSNRNDKSVGVYRKAFDLKGKSLGNQMTEIQRVESLYNVYEALEFQTKHWMVCLILP